MKKNVKALILSLLATLAVGSLSACDMFGGFWGGETSNSTDMNSEAPGESSDVASSDNSVDTPDSSVGEVEDEVVISLAETESVMRFESKQLTATVKGSVAKPTWTTSNPEVATVDENGLVSALTLGEAVITASIGDVSASCTVTVTETNIPHEIEISLDEISVFEGKTSEEITVDVSFGGEVLEGDFEYTWSLVEGEEDVVSLEASEDGKSAVFTGLKPGTVTYEIYTVARGYETAREITITVRENVYSLGVSHKDIVTVGDGYAVDLTLGDETTDKVTFGDAYLAVNGAESEESVVVTWSIDNDNILFEDGTITAVKAGTSVLTGTATYKDKTLATKITVSVAKGQIALDDTDMLEVATATAFNVPASVDKGEIEKIYFGDVVVFDKANGVSSIDGNVVTFNEKTSLPVKDEDLGLGKELTIETNLIVYTMSVDVYTMIIDSVEELDSWQAVAAENAVKAGVCIEAQKGLVTSGYFALGANIEYNKVWKPYKAYGELWALCYRNPNIWIDQSTYKAGTAPAEGNRVEGTIVADWGNGAFVGFQGTFDGQGHYINGMQTANLGDDGYNAFIVTLGGGTVKNVAFMGMTIGSNCGSVVDRGHGLIENVYVQVDVIQSGKAENMLSWGLIREGSNAKHTVNNSIIDYSEADLSNVEYVNLGCDIKSEVLTGVYVVGVPADFKGQIWNHEGVARHQIGVYETYAGLFADAAAKLLVSEWNGVMWEVGEGYVVAKSVKGFYSGDFNITNTETKIPAGASLALSTDKFTQYIAYSLKEEAVGVSVVANQVVLTEEAVVGSTFTVVATNLIDGTAKEITLTVDRALEKVAAENTVDVDLGLSLNGTKVVTAESASLNLAEIYETYLKGNTVTVKYGKKTVYEGVIDSAMWTMPLAQVEATVNGAGAITFYVASADKNYEITLPVNFVQTVVELNSTNVADPTALRDILLSNPYGNYVLTSDLNMKGYRLVGMKEFYGTIDGNGHVIYNTLLDESSLANVDGNNVYNPTFIMYNYGTIKNIGFKLDKLTRARGGRPRGVVYTNCGTVENVYLDVTFVEEQMSSTDMTYYLTGALVDYNEGTLKNALVNVSLAAGAVVYENTTAAVVYENKENGTVENVYAINNGNTTVVAAVKGVGEDAAVLYTSWAEVTDADLTALGNLWKKEGATIYFGSTIVYDATVREEIEDTILANTNNVATLSNAAFTVGSTWKVDVNGVVSDVTISEEGKLAVTLDPNNLNSGYLAVVTVKGGEQELRFNNVIKPIYISTVEELKALGVGQNRTNTSDIEGYFVLANDITFEHAEDGSDIVTAGYPKNGDYYFKGTFDGNGYALKNMRVSDGGIFGLMRNATVKNLKLENVYLKNDPPQGISVQNGGYSAILAFSAPSTTFENINITVASAPNSWSWKRDGLLVCSTSWGASTFRNITIDASYLSLNTLLGISHHTGNVYENVVIKAADYVAIGYTADSYGSDGNQNTAALMKEFPAGVTFMRVAYADVPNAIKAMNSTPNVKYLSDNETALGFTAGTHVYKVTTTNQWSDCISIPADDSYDYVEFDVVFTVEIGNATAWPAPAGGGTNGSFGVYTKGVLFSNDAQTKVRTIQIFKPNGDTFKAQSGDKFAANVKYTFRFGFNENESIAAFQFGTATNQTYYISNARFGNLDGERVYDSTTGALHAYYEGDVTALGFAAGTKVTSVAITDGWGKRVRINGDVNYDYVEFQFSVNKAVDSYALWAYANNGSILPGNYNVYNYGGAKNTDETPERKITVTDINGGAVTAFAANTVYVVRVYLDDTASSLAFSTFSTSAEDPVTISFGTITFGNDPVADPNQK